MKAADLLRLREIIQNAFANTPYPGDDNIAYLSDVDHFEADMVSH
jgi:hypothetical protein